MFVIVLVNFVLWYDVKDFRKRNGITKCDILASNKIKNVEEIQKLLVTVSGTNLIWWFTF